MINIFNDEEIPGRLMFETDIITYKGTRYIAFKLFKAGIQKPYYPRKIFATYLADGSEIRAKKITEKAKILMNGMGLA